MIQISIESRKQHSGIAIGYTEEWIKQTIREFMLANYGDHDLFDLRVHGAVNEAFDAVVDRWEHLETLSIADVIEEEAEAAIDWRLRIAEDCTP